MYPESNLASLAVQLSFGIQQWQSDSSQTTGSARAGASVSLLPKPGIPSVDALMAEQVADWEEKAAGLQNHELSLLKSATQLVSILLSQGQVCLPLHQAPVGQLAACWPSEACWLEVLNNARSVWITDLSGATEPCWRGQPLVLTMAGDQPGSTARLYLARYFFYQQDVVKHLQLRLADAHVRWQSQDTEALLIQLREAYKSSCPVSKDWKPYDWQADRQSIAVATAALLPLTFIVGGPGTGKTTTVARLLTMMLELDKSCRVALAAPTGKAAARMTEAIQQVFQRPMRHAGQGNETVSEDQPDAGPNGLPKAYTLHRLLGWSPGGFKYHSKRFLPYQMVVLDEASMVDLPMMAHLLDALAPDTKLVMLGDRYQLASVEAGSVLADICSRIPSGRTSFFASLVASVMGEEQPDTRSLTASDKPPALLTNAIVELTQSYRFGADSGIGLLAMAINAGDAAAATKVFEQHQDVHISVNNVCSNGVSTEQYDQTLALALAKGYRSYALKVKQYHQGLVSVVEVIRAFESFRVLVAVRDGPLGLERINQIIETMLIRQGWLMAGRQPNWYAGRPLMITRNDADTGLYNGDIGLLLKDNQGHLRAVFHTGNGEILELSPIGLPPHETCFATTVHKCQGSEFDEVMLVLPDRRSRVVSRELLYTAVTRARKHFSVFTTEDCFNSALSRATKRASGMAEILWP